MKLGRLVTGMILAGGALAAAKLVWAMETGLDARRQSLASTESYWSCIELPPTPILARMYARRVVSDQWPDGMRSLHWQLTYVAYTAYVRHRLSHDELADGFLKTPAASEKSCTALGEVAA